MEEEIDLRPYIAAVFRYWLWILGAGFLAVVIAFLMLGLRPKTYQAVSTLAILRSRTDVTFDTRIIDIDEAELLRPDANSRRQALMALATNNNIALSVRQELQDTLPSELRSVPALMNIVDISNEGDLIEITVRHKNPEIAAAVANAWAEQYQMLVNRLYGETRPNDAELVTSQAQAATQSYQSAQTQLETFIGSNRLTTLEGEIAARQTLLSSYRNALTAVQAEPIDLQTNNYQIVLSGYYTNLQKIELWLSDAQALREQVVADGSSNSDLGNTLALLNLKNRVFGESSAVALQIDLATDIAEPVRTVDVDVVITVLEARRETTLAQIDEAITAWTEAAPQNITLPDSHPHKVRITQLEQEIQGLQAELEDQQSQLRELQQTRDLAWETYDTLARKLTEEQLASQATGTEVRLATRAMVPERPVAVSKILISGGAGIAAVILAVMIIIMYEVWRQNFAVTEPTVTEPQPL